MHQLVARNSYNRSSVTVVTLLESSWYIMQKMQQIAIESSYATIAMRTIAKELYVSFTSFLS